MFISFIPGAAHMYSNWRLCCAIVSQEANLLGDLTEFPTQLVRDIDQETSTDGSMLQKLATFPVFVAKCIKDDIDEALSMEREEDEQSDADDQPELSKAGSDINLVESVTSNVLALVKCFKTSKHQELEPTETMSGKKPEELVQAETVEDQELEQAADMTDDQA